MRLQKYKKKSIHHNFNIKFNIIKASAKAKLAWIMPSTNNVSEAIAPNPQSM